jgi:glycosyltransferase involved in cell wall biosynthesis
VKPLLSNSYLKSLYRGDTFNKLSILKSYLLRILYVFQFWKYDVIWLEKEMLPYLPSFLELIPSVFKKKIIVDYDDAVFHIYDTSKHYFVRKLFSNKIDRVMKVADYVVVGNEYLEDRSKLNNKNTVLIPTVVDFNKYSEVSKSIEQSNVVKLGWIGTPYTQKYLLALSDVLDRLSIDVDYELHLIGANESIYPKFKNTNLIIHSWHAETEISLLQSLDVGLMPIPDESFERGKCGYKLIQYLACGKPVIGSDVGVNRKIIENCEGGFIVSTKEEWYDGLYRLLTDKNLRDSLSKSAQDGVYSFYSVESQASRMLSLLQK